MGLRSYRWCKFTPPKVELIIINLILIGIFQDLRLWFFLRFILGGAINVVYVLSETTLIEISPQKYRGRLLGAYTSISTLGYAAGPTVLAVIGSEGLTPFIITSFILSISVIPIIFAPIHIHQPTNTSQKTGSITSFLRMGWILVLAYASTTLFDNAFMSLLPAYGMKSGLNEHNIAIILSVIMIGGVATQIPIGWLIDHASKTAMIFFCVVIGTTGFLTFPLLLHNMFCTVVVSFFWGATVLGVQTISLIELGSNFKDEMLVAGNSSFALMWGVSGIVGIPIAGTAMDIIGPNGLLLVVGGVFIISCTLFALSIFNSKSKLPSAKSET